VFERSEFLVTPKKIAFSMISDNPGGLFFGSVSFGHAKEMNAQRQRIVILYKYSYF